MTPGRVLCAMLASALVSALPTETAAQTRRDGGPPNLLVLVADDLGVDRVGAYGEHPDPGHTPVVDGLAAGGVLFRNAWSNPVCAPSRATMLTGRYARETGLGWGSGYQASPVELPLDEVTVAEVLAPTHRTAAVGKWHLASAQVSGLLHPNLQGFEHFRGTMGKLPGFIDQDAYFVWEKVVDGVVSTVSNYATTEAVDDALQLVAGFGDDPWFLWLAFHAPHAPYHAPPPGLHTFALPPAVEDDIPLHAQAAIEAMDTEIGRLLDGLGPAVLDETIVVFVGDNGTDGPATTAPFDPDHAKGTVFEGGVNVPLVVQGPGVAQGAECAGLVNLTDLFATLAELAGAAAPTGTDSVSLLPYLSQPDQPSLRTTVYTEIFFPNGPGAYQTRERAIRNADYKLVHEHEGSIVPGTARFFDLAADPFETTNLLEGPLSHEESVNLDRLALQLEEPYEPWIELGFGVPGATGTPQLTGSGSLQPGSPFALALTGAAPGALAALAIGGTNLSAPFAGGLFVPSPDLILFFGTDPAGELAGTDVWPPGLPGGIPVLFQFWIFDATAPDGLASSNGLAATTPPP